MHVAVHDYMTTFGQFLVGTFIFVGRGVVVGKGVRHNIFSSLSVKKEGTQLPSPKGHQPHTALCGSAVANIDLKTI